MLDLGQLCGMIGARLFAVRAGLGAQVSEFATKTVHVLASFLRGCVRCRGLRFGAGLCELSFGGRLLRSVNGGPREGPPPRGSPHRSPRRVGTARGGRTGRVHFLAADASSTSPDSSTGGM